MSSKNLDGKLFKNVTSGQILKFLTGTYTSHLPFRGQDGFVMWRGLGKSDLQGECMNWIFTLVTLNYLKTHENKRKLFPSLLSLITCQPVPHPHTPPFTGRPGHTHTYPSFFVLAPNKPVVLLVALTCCVSSPLRLINYRCLLTLLTFSDLYVGLYSHICTSI